LSNSTQDEGQCYTGVEMC